MTQATDQAPPGGPVVYEIVVKLRNCPGEAVVYRSLPQHAQRRAVVAAVAAFLDREPGDVAVLSFGPMSEMRFDAELAARAAAEEAVRRGVIAAEPVSVPGVTFLPAGSRYEELRAAARGDVLHSMSLLLAAGSCRRAAARAVRHVGMSIVEASVHRTDVYLAARVRGVVDALAEIEAGS